MNNIPHAGGKEHRHRIKDVQIRLVFQDGVARRRGARVELDQAKDDAQGDQAKAGIHSRQIDAPPAPSLPQGPATTVALRAQHLKMEPHDQAREERDEPFLQADAAHVDI